MVKDHCSYIRQILKYLMLISANFIFKKPSFLALFFLLRVFQWTYRKSVLYLTRLNQLFSIILDHFLSFVTFIDI